MSDAVIPIPVWRGFSTAFAIVADGQCGLVDAGFRGSAERILQELSARGVPEPSWVLATHLHIDHIGGMAAIHAKTGAPVMAHALEAPFIDGRQRPPQYPKRGTGKILHHVERFIPYDPVPVARELNDGDTLPFPEELQLVHLPGHTAGHSGIWWPERRVLLVGDAVMRFGRRMILGWPMDTQDPEAALESARRIVSLEPEAIHLAHGGCLSGGDISRISDAREGRLRQFLPGLS